ncbi:MAG: hypothetical protein EBZ47_04945 [Chlamydiae bacterium]|nr:hypothetical protein [Chlamydiota bacterium]
MSFFPSVSASSEYQKKVSPIFSGGELSLAKKDSLNRCHQISFASKSPEKALQRKPSFSPITDDTHSLDGDSPAGLKKVPLTRIQHFQEASRQSLTPTLLGVTKKKAGDHAFFSHKKIFVSTHYLSHLKECNALLAIDQSTRAPKIYSKLDPMNDPKEFLKKKIALTFQHANKALKSMVLISSGGFGHVYRAVLSSEVASERNYVVALKINRISQDTIYKGAILKEIAIYKKIRELDQENALPFGRFIKDFSLDPHTHVLIQEFYPCNLYQWMQARSSKGLSMGLTYVMARQLFQALSFLKNQLGRLMHSDLKPENIMIATPGELKIKIIDFGVASVAPQKNSKGEGLGSLFYLAPEVILKLPLDERVDLWSVACILFEVYTGYPLFPASSYAELISMICELIGPVPSDRVVNIRKGDLKKQFIAVPSSSGGFFYDFYVPGIDLQTHRAEVFANFLERNEFSPKISLDPHPPLAYTNIIFFKELLLKILMWRPESRISLEEIFEHPFMKRMEQRIHYL